MIIESNEVLEKRPIEPVDKKKRQQIQQIEGSHHTICSNSTINNEISMAASKQVVRSQ